MEETNDNSKQDHEKLKQKIFSSVEKLNKSTFVFDSMIEDYNLLYEKYIELQIAQEQNQRSMSLKKRESIISKGDNTEEDYNFLKDKYFKLKETNENNLQTIKNHLENIMKLQEKIDIKDKKIKGYQAENSALKSQNIQLDKKNKELNKINDENEKKISKLNKSCQRMEIDHKKLIEDSVQMHINFEKINNKCLELEKKCLNNNIDITPNIKKEEINNDKKENEIIDKNQINLNKKSKGGEFPNKLLYKQKVHFKTITSIDFNKSGDKYITTSEDNSLILLNTAKNSEISKYSEFNNIITEACFNKSNNLIFAGSFDLTAKLINSQNLNLVTNFTFTEHSKEINCVKCYHLKEGGLTGSSDNTIKEWDFDNKTLIQELNYKSPTHSLDIASNDNFILSGHGDGVVNMWTGDISKQAKLCKIHDDRILDIKIVNDNTFLSLSKDKKIKLFDIRNEKEIFTINDEKIKDICESNIVISPDKKYFGVGSKEGNVYIININNGEIENTINNNNGRGEVKSIFWNSSNYNIYIGDSNGFISIWGN
jgi:WD40 repeat protein